MGAGPGNFHLAEASYFTVINIRVVDFLAGALKNGALVPIYERDLRG